MIVLQAVVNLRTITFKVRTAAEQASGVAPLHKSASNVISQPSQDYSKAFSTSAAYDWKRWVLKWVIEKCPPLR